MKLTWAELALVDRIDREHATDLFSEWPWSPSAVLEVRRCACGEPVTRVIEPGHAEPQLSCTHRVAPDDRDLLAPSALEAGLALHGRRIAG